MHRAFTIYNKGGNKGSLTGTYVDARGKKLVREEDSIYFENSETIGNLPKGFNLPVGSKWELYIPYNLAYGDRDSGKIKPYSALIFTVELLEIEDNAVNKAKATLNKSKAKVTSAKK